MYRPLLKLKLKPSNIRRDKLDRTNSTEDRTKVRKKKKKNYSTTIERSTNCSKSIRTDVAIGSRGLIGSQRMTSRDCNLQEQQLIRDHSAAPMIRKATEQPVLLRWRRKKRTEWNLVTRILPAQEARRLKTRLSETSPTTGTIEVAISRSCLPRFH